MQKFISRSQYSPKIKSMMPTMEFEQTRQARLPDHTNQKPELNWTERPRGPVGLADLLNPPAEISRHLPLGLKLPLYLNKPDPHYALVLQHHSLILIYLSRSILHVARPWHPVITFCKCWRGRKRCFPLKE